MMRGLGIVSVVFLLCFLLFCGVKYQGYIGSHEPEYTWENDHKHSLTVNSRPERIMDTSRVEAAVYTSELSPLIPEDGSHTVAPARQPEVKLKTDSEVQSNSSSASRAELMTLALVACGDRCDEAVVTIKSLVMFTRSAVNIIVFADDNCKDIINNKTAAFPRKFNLKYYGIQESEGFLDSVKYEAFKPCCTQRLALPDIVRDVDKLIYVDTDVLFFAPFEEIWAEFHKFDSVQIAGLIYHDETDAIRTYNDKAVKTPYYKPFGLNSGVILMDLPRMRAANWSRKIGRFHRKYHNLTIYGDQDLINILFFYEPELVYRVPCKYNYRIGHCMFGAKVTCLPVVDEGVSLFHGIMSVFRDPKTYHQGIDALYKLFQSHDFSKPFTPRLRSLVSRIRNMTYEQERCGFSIGSITKRMIQANV